jgi:hypothetical protein
MMAEIASRGWEVGLHASWNSYDDVDEMKYQKEQVERAIGRDIVSVRQHFLHYDPRVTPRVHALAGFKYDLSVGFNLGIGFRRGTCWLRPLPDLQTGEVLNLGELPLVIQDGSLLSPSKGLRLQESEAQQHVERLMAEVEEVSGVFTALWHPNNIISPRYMHVYESILARGQERGALIGPAEHIGAVWQQ